MRHTPICCPSACAIHCRSAPACRSRSTEVELRTSRSSGPGGQHANVTASRVEAVVRRRGLGDAVGRAEGARRRAARPPRHRAGAGHPFPGAQPRARARAARRAAGPRARGAAPADRHAADRGVATAPAGGQAPAERGQARARRRGRGDEESRRGAEGGRDLRASNVLHIRMRAAPVLALLLLGAPSPRPRRRGWSTSSGRPPRRRSSTPPTTTARRTRLLGAGQPPAVSPDGRWVAYVTVPRNSRDLEELILVPSRRRAAAADPRPLHHRRPLLPELGPARGDRARAARAALRHRPGRHGRHGARLHPRLLVLARRRAARLRHRHRPDVGAPSDIYIAPLDRSVERRRITTTGDALNPVWGPTEIIYDRQRRRRGNRPPTTCGPRTRRAPRRPGSSRRSRSRRS